MNILFLSTHLNAGGITSYLLTMSKGLMRRGHGVHVATSGGNMENEFLAAGARLLTLDIRTKSELSPKIYLALFPLKKYVREQNIDLIHSQTRITQVMGAMLGKATGRAYVSTCHGFFKAQRLSRKLFPCWGRAVIAISGPVKDHLINDFRVSPENINLTESGIDVESFVPVGEQGITEARQRFDLGEGPVLGMIARLSDVKGQDILIEAMSKIVASVPDVKLLLVGEGRMEPLLRERVEQLHLEDHVRFLAIVHKTQEMLPLFDVFVVPSRQEGLGLSIMEAQAMGVPVVASRVGGIPSLIEHGKTGILVDPKNSVQLADAIIELLKNRERGKAMGLAGREFIRKTHSAEKMIDEAVQFYEISIAKNSEKHSCCQR
ncbi:MAG TPA: glycosyltransferase family 4 protein [Candidatus Omnitrophota bacterium]|nr:glycosyltransferase family 4 protein [Candidatus Omnitrophota bacterium]